MPRLKLLAGSALVLVMFFSCEDFQSQNYEISPVDARACTLLSDSVFKVIRTQSPSEINATWVQQTVLDSAEKAFTTLAKKKVQIAVQDSGYLFVSSIISDTSYVALTGDSGSSVLYLGEYLDVKIYDMNGTELAVLDDTMTPETVGGCMELVVDKYQPIIKTRLVFNTKAENYLLSIIKIDQTVNQNFRSTVIIK